MYNTNTCILKPKKKNQKKTKLYIPFYDKNKLNIVFRSKIKNKLNLVEQKGIYRSTRKDYKWGIRNFVHSPFKYMFEIIYSIVYFA